jgi:hypothetical protein
MAREAGFPFNKYGLLQGDDGGEIDADKMFEAFAALVRADEREQALAAPVQEPVFTYDQVKAHIQAAMMSAAQPAVPDAIHHTDTSETLDYIQGWNDCRAEMLKGSHEPV